MQDREAEFESLGAEAMPANFSCIDRVMREGREDLSILQDSSKQFQPIGLVMLIERWLDKRANH